MDKKEKQKKKYAYWTENDMKHFTIIDFPVFCCKSPHPVYSNTFPEIIIMSFIQFHPILHKEILNCTSIHKSFVSSKCVLRIYVV